MKTSALGTAHSSSASMHDCHQIIERNVLNLIGHNSVWINCPVEEVWPYIMSPNSWKHGLKLYHRAGNKNEAGEIFAALLSAEDDLPKLYVETVEVVPNSTRSIKIYCPEDWSLSGHSSWMLYEKDGGTLLEYHVYSEHGVVKSEWDQMNQHQKIEMQRQFSEENNRRFRDELAGLKSVIEHNYQQS
ncbi:hypothetical protein HBA55_01240 [Pseudomaricurvus alkylphenolicus]|uniref:hypothetical protein n=1 Tax=Pseudomaricurvus alkylphenolicus TaxID=1306991 RepID=UPI001423E04A|nr:hypothetical protein [Pseudomaricurvus alkylphenolicus]NIB38186.1 hypothetical protein [Pseudomaricurvus alkylphenolicus]